MQTYQTKVMSRLGYVVTGVARTIEATGRAVKLRNVKVKVAGYVGAGVEQCLGTPEVLSSSARGDVDHA
jgi:hypothetical protein